MSNTTLNGKTAVICSTELCIAQRFAQAGARVIIAHDDQAQGAEDAAALRVNDMEVDYEPLDARDPAQCDALVRKLTLNGSLHVWVNHHAHVQRTPAETLSPDDWNKHITNILSATFYCAQAAGRHMLAQRTGVIINISNVAGMLHESGQLALSVAQAGVIALTEALGVEWAGRGVRVVGIAPPSPEHTARRTPLKRSVNSEDIAEAALFLASNEASYIVAETLRVDGGWTAYQLF